MMSAECVQANFLSFALCVDRNPHLRRELGDGERFANGLWCLSEEAVVDDGARVLPS